MKSIRNLSIVIILFVVIFPSAAQTWTQVPSPNPGPIRSMLRDIAGTDPNNIWAVGTFQTSPQMAQYYADNLVMKWDGTAWQLYTVPNIGVTLNDLYCVEMLSPTEGWAGGHYDVPGQGSMAQLLHWNGITWSHHPLPNPSTSVSLDAMDAVSSTEIWAAGFRSGNVALSLFYNGTHWSEIPVPQVGTFRNYFNDIDGINPNDAWAVGHWSNNYGDFHTLSMHWDGNTWTYYPLPSNITNQLSEILNVEMISTNDVWATGYYLTGGMFMVHWDGSAWTEFTSYGGGGSIAALGPNDVYATGGEIVHWDGSSWSIVDSLSQHFAPALGNTVVLPNGEIWAAGREVDLNGIFTTLVYRRSSITGINEEDKISNVSVYPNPLQTGQSVCTVQGSFSGETNLHLYSTDGKLIFSRMYISEGMEEFNIQFPDLSPGSYMLKITWGTQSSVHKIIRL